MNRYQMKITCKYLWTTVFIWKSLNVDVADFFAHHGDHQNFQKKALFTIERIAPRFSIFDIKNLEFQH